MIYLGFLTTAVSVHKEEFIIHRFAYIVIAGLLVYFLITKKLFLHKYIIFGLLSLLGLSLISVILNKASLFLVIRTFVGLLAIQIALFSYFKFYNYDYKVMLRHYIIIALILSYIGIFQEISYLTGFIPGYDFSWFLPSLRGHLLEDLVGSGPVMRITSLCGEPGYLAPSLIPAGFITLHNLINDRCDHINKVEGVVVLIAILLTFSAIGYIGILISLLYNINWHTLRKHKFIIVGFSTLLIILIYKVDYFQSRVDGIYRSLYDTDNFTGQENVSSLIVVINYKISVDNFIKHPLIGSGLDSFKIVSNNSLDYMNLDVGFVSFIKHMDGVDMRFEDGSMMYFRILTELGLVGIIIIGWFLYNNKINIKDNNVSILQDMCLVYFIVYGLRTGQYIRFELWYFIGLYYCMKKYYGMNHDDRKYCIQ